MKKYIVFVPAEKRNDNPYINSYGYLINPSNNDLLIYNLTHAKDKAQLFGGSYHEYFTIKCTDDKRVKEVSGTLDYLINYFSYTLEVGNSWNKKINRNPKTIKSFITNLQNAYSEKEAACYNRTFIELM